ncbi:Glycosyltransferase involved in cell wall bisynthesis [Pseudomonas sp. NFACC37-1]|nr:glycosyltransferase family 4 protein [Pseudomonas sp. NFACC37-1]SCY57013.1 Glycosyltransferase involved in cell wall bisynthesis [Pseudomonas sp. NFACC37-1]
MKVAHVTSAHTRFDIRIFQKECKTLAAHGYDVSLVVADGKGDEKADGVNIVDVGFLRGRLNRMFKTTKMVYKKAASLQADIYHLHDPELIPVGLKLKKLGKIVIFDSHEDVPKQILSKPYLRPVSRRVISFLFSVYERFACRKMDGILTATPYIRDKFLSINANVVDINNFPLVGELAADVAWGEKKQEVCYVGGITSIRGIREVVEAMGLVHTGSRLNLVGNFSEPGVEVDVKKKNGWSSVNQCGQLGRSEVRDILGRSAAGLVTFYPLPNHVDAQPNKMFEYMSSGIPVIASNFPLWREIIEGNDCGVCVDPLNPQSIADAIDFIIENPERAEQMGRNGQKAVTERYNWDVEGRRLLKFYAGLAKG